MTPTNRRPRRRPQLLPLLVPAVEATAEPPGSDFAPFRLAAGAYRFRWVRN